MAYENIKIETEGGLAIVTVNRPKVLNALNDATLAELEMAFGELEHDGMTRVVIITGEGEKAFVAGADIAELQKADVIAARRISELGHRVFAAIETSDLISIAAINGFALGGGCELAMACDIRYAADNAKLGQPEVNLGIIPGYGGTQRMPRLVGRGKALELLLSGDMVGADQALSIGLVQAVFPAGELIEEAKKLARKILSKGPLTIGAVKSCVRQGLESPLPAGCSLETARFSAVFASADKNEGTSAFLEKRTPDFSGK